MSIFVLLTMLLLSAGLFAQTPAQKQQIQQQSNLSKLNQLQKENLQKAQLQKKNATKAAQENGWQTQIMSRDGYSTESSFRW